MTLKQLLEKLAKEAAELRAKAAAGTLTDDDIKRAEEVTAEHAATKAKLDQMEATAKAMGSISTIEVTEPEPQDNGGLVGKSLGERFVNSGAYKAFQKTHPTGLSDGTPVHIKAQVTTKADPNPLNREGLGMEEHQPRFTDDLVVRPEPTLLDLIYVGTTNESYLPYRQVVTKTNNASIVAETKDPAAAVNAATGLKPLSELTTQPADAKVYDYADGMTVTNQELRDDGAIKALIDSTLRENLSLTVEDIILNGSGVGLEPKGILNTTGVLNQPFATDMATTIRKAKTKLKATRTRIQAVVVNPEDAETWDLQKDSTGRYLGFGPFGVGPQTAWNVRIVESEALDPGTALMGDFRQVHLLIRSALQILAFNQHENYARLNLQYIRAELAAMQLIRRPANLCVVNLAAAGE